MDKTSSVKNKFQKSTRKDCFNEDRIIYELDKKIDESFITFLKKFGKVKVYREFNIPLITMDIPDKMRLSALLTSKRLDIFFKKKRPKDYIQLFEEKLNKQLNQ